MFWNRIFATKSLEMLDAEAKGDNRLRRVLGPVGLTSLGVGAIIGAGIFVMTGRVAAEDAGPAIVVSFVVAGIACALAAFCYAEFSSMAPVAGSAYTYAYAILGELFAWIIGWDLILEYAVSNMSVAVGFSAYLQDLGDNLFGYHLPAAIAYPMFAAPGTPSGIFNIPALIITMLVTWVLVMGVKEGARANTIMVGIKIAAILIFCFGSMHAIHTDNWKP